MALSLLGEIALRAAVIAPAGHRQQRTGMLGRLYIGTRGRKQFGVAVSALAVANMFAMKPSRTARMSSSSSSSSSGVSGKWESFTPVSQGKPPISYRRIDHIVLRCKDVQKMLDFYVGVLGAESEWVGRMGGCLTHLRIGSSLIDLQAYCSPVGWKLHAGGSGLPQDAPIPPCDPEAGTLDHFAINVDPYDPVAVREYLTSLGHPPFAEGVRYGADGEGYSMYLRDPENNVVELKCGATL
eukprot:TRINITY_DN94269_c0_g1_i1.p1 TRINITY_DN94269_c0_g1~~TRINITY_DN94269_c0_g1_i1.p1  ORF type:complete len:240 (+),score=24.15 TRINITY_DN94269_c0_g1_i1:59-778(+)